MNVQEILEDADLLVPNAFTESQKIRWLNQVQTQIYNDIKTEAMEPPAPITEDYPEFIPWLPEEYHELLSFGVAKRTAERTKDYKTAGELELRYQNLLLVVKQRTAPKMKKVQRIKHWH